MTVLSKTLWKIRYIRKELLLDMAKKLKVSPAFLSKIQDGKYWLLYSQLQMLRNNYDLSEEENKQLDYAFCHQDEEYIPTEEEVARGEEFMKELEALRKGSNEN